MYDYRVWTPKQRAEALAERKSREFPWHGPPHLEHPGHFRIVTGTCFEHQHLLGDSARLAWFERELLAHLKSHNIPCAAWVILPNHYHVLVRIGAMKKFAFAQGRLHGRTSFLMNRQDGQRGRQVWYRCQDRVMRSEAHYWTTLNYIHNNPLKHGYVKKWTDWPYSSVHWYIENKGRDRMLDVWDSYPVLNYGDKWDL